MDELSNQNETSSEVFDAQEPQNNTLSIEHNTENIPLIDQSDDDPLLFTPPMPTNRKGCSRYWLEILIGFIILLFVVMIIIVGMLFIKDSKIFVASGNGCNMQSETGKSCSIDDLETTLLIRLQSTYSSSIQKSNYTFNYTALSHISIITFSFKKGWNWYLGRVSIRDLVSDVELIKDGGFETGTMYAYCICDSSLQRTKPTAAGYDQPGPYICDVKTFFSAVQLAQSVNTIPGRNYSVSFWLESQSGATENNVAVYMSSTSKIDVPTLLRTTFIIILVILYIF